MRGRDSIIKMNRAAPTNSASFIECRGCGRFTLQRSPVLQVVGRIMNDSMKAIEADNDDLKDVLPRTYNRLDKELLVPLMKAFSKTSMDIEGDAFGRSTNTSCASSLCRRGKVRRVVHALSVVKLIVEIIKPFLGRI